MSQPFRHVPLETQECFFLPYRLETIRKAQLVAERLRIRIALAEHQIKQLRLDLSRSEAQSLPAPELSSRLQTIRHEVDAKEEVDELFADGLGPDGYSNTRSTPPSRSTSFR